MVYGNFIGRNKYETTGTHDGGHFSGVPWVSALINGRGRYIHPGSGMIASNVMSRGAFKFLNIYYFYRVTQKKVYAFG